MTFACTACGVSSRREAFFRDYWTSVSAPPERYCPACWAAREARTQRLAVAVTAGGILLVLLVGALLPSAEAALAGLGLWLVALYVVSTVLHELGHAGAAWAVGLEVRTISFGSGPVLSRTRLLGLELQLRSLPICGFVQTSFAAGALARLRSAAVTAAGPAVNAALLGAGLAVAGWPDRALAVEEVSPWHLLVGVNALILVVNVVPFALTGAGRLDDPVAEATGQPNDGLLLLQQLFAPRASVEAWAAAGRLLEVRDLLRAGRADEARARAAEEGAADEGFSARLLRARALLEAGAPAEAARRLEALDRGGLAPPERAAVLALAGEAGLAEGEAGLPRALRARAELEALAPRSFEALWLGGRTALAEGRPGEAIQRLEDALAVAGDEETSAQVAQALARAHDARGWTEQAERFRHLAARLARQGVAA